MYKNDIKTDNIMFITLRTADVNESCAITVVVYVHSRWLCVTLAYC
jgi:hypothetical protein